jgi:hypothetical protein
MCAEFNPNDSNDESDGQQGEHGDERARHPNQAEIHFMLSQ